MEGWREEREETRGIKFFPSFATTIFKSTSQGKPGRPGIGGWFGLKIWNRGNDMIIHTRRQLYLPFQIKFSNSIWYKWVKRDTTYKE